MSEYRFPETRARKLKPKRVLKIYGDKRKPILKIYSCFDH